MNKLTFNQIDTLDNYKIFEVYDPSQRMVATIEFYPSVGCYCVTFQERFWFNLQCLEELTVFLKKLNKKGGA